MKNILLIGETDNINSTTIEIKDAFEKLGYHVTSFNFRSISKKFSVFNSKDRFLDFFFKKLNKIGFSFLYYNLLGRYKMTKELLKYKFENFDFVLFTKCEFINPKTFKIIKKYTPVYYYFFDSMKEISNYRLYNHFNYSSKSFVVSKIMSEVLSSHKKINKLIFYCPQGVDIKKWKINNNLPKIYDIVFIGSRNAYRDKYINYLKKNGIEIICYGLGYRNGEVYNEDLNKIYQKSKIALNFTRDRISFSIRVYQIISSGCFVLSSKSEELNRIFNRGKHFDDFDSPKECLKKIKFYLESDNTRNSIVINSYNKVIKTFNWEKILKVFDGKKL